MDKIEMIMQKYGDKIQVGYKALRDQYFAYEIISTFMVFAIIGFFVSLIGLSIINVTHENFDRDYFDKEWSGYKTYRFKRRLVYLNFILPIIFAIIFFIILVLIPVFAPDYGFIRSLIGD
jgi:hypothetical protein